MPKRAPRPNTWVTGPDPLRHKQYRAFIQQKNQAQFRGEDWQLSFEDWIKIWGTDFDRRGRLADSLCLTRWDLDDAWSVNNCILMERRDHMRRCGRKSHGEEV